MNEIVHKELFRLLEGRTVTFLKSAWTFSFVVATEKDWNLHVWIDYRSLNKIVKPDSFPLPDMEEILKNFNGFSMFITFALLSGPWQVPLAETCRDMTASTCKYATFRF